MPAPDAYIDWLLNRSRPIRPYTNRRRALNYSLLVDNSQIVGYEFKNPLTGYNYAYRVRVAKQNATEDERKLKRSFTDQAWKVAACTLYTGLTNGMRDVGNLVVYPILYTEVPAWQVRRKRQDRLGATREQ